MTDARADTAVVFVYTGPRGEGVPRDVVRVRVDPSVTSIPADAFYERKKLAEVELCEGHLQIGECTHRSLQLLDNEDQHPQLTQKD